MTSYQNEKMKAVFGRNEGLTGDDNKSSRNDRNERLKNNKIMNQLEVENKFYKDSTTFVHHTVNFENESALGALLVNGKDPKRTSIMNDRPLCCALKIDNEKMIAALEELGAVADNFFQKNYNKISYFQKACKINQKEFIKLLLEHNCDVNAEFLPDSIICSPGTRPLHLNVVFKGPNESKLLLSYDADENIINKEKETTLHGACEAGHPEIVEMLSKKHLTPLYKRVENAKYEVLELLLRNGMMLECENSETIIYFYVSLDKAMMDKNIQIISYFLDLDLDSNIKFLTSKNRTNSTFGRASVSCQSTALVNLLLERYTDKKLPIHIAAEFGNLQVVKQLLQIEGKKNYSTISIADEASRTPLHVASEINNHRCIQALISFKANLSAKTSNGDTPLHLACKKANVETVKVLVDNGSPLDLVDINGNTPVHIAVNIKSDEILELLLQQGASLTIKNKEKQIPLSIAIEEHDKKFIYLLLKFSKDVNHEYYKEVFSNVMRHPEKENLRIVQTFIQHGFILTPQDNDAVVSLFWAIVDDDITTIKSAIGKNVDVNLIIGGQTLLHLASFFGHRMIVKTLLNHGADRTIKNQDDKLPIYYAYLHGDKDIADMFLDDGERRCDFKLLQNYPEIMLYPILAFGHNYYISGANFYSRMLKSLKLRGANINYCDKDGRNALHLLLGYLFRSPNKNIDHCDDENYFNEYCLSNGCGSRINFGVHYDGYYIDSFKYGEKEYGADYMKMIKDKDNIGVCLFRFLINWGVDVNAKTHVRNEGVIHAAVMACRWNKRQSYELVEALLSRPELHLDSVNGNGETALQIAYRRVLLELALILVKHGADLSLFNPKCYETPGWLNAEMMDKPPVTVHSYEPVYYNYTPAYCSTVSEKDMDKFMLAFRDDLLRKLVKREKVSHNHKLLCVDFEEHERFVSICTEELTRLEQIKVAKTNVRDMLKKNTKELVHLVRNAEVAKVVIQVLGRSSGLKIYPTMLFRCFSKAVWRKHLIDAAKDPLRYITRMALPDICAERVLEYLEDVELEQLCKTRPESANVSASFSAEMLRIKKKAKGVEWSSVLQHSFSKSDYVKHFMGFYIWNESLNLVMAVICASKVARDIEDDADDDDDDDDEDDDDNDGEDDDDENFIDYVSDEDDEFYYYNDHEDDYDDNYDSDFDNPYNLYYDDAFDLY